MNKRLFVAFIALFLMGGVGQSYAQISDATTTQRTIRTGNRPDANDWGIYIGPSVTEIIEMCDKNTNWRGIPLINVKYYIEKNLEFRTGIQFYGTATNRKGQLWMDENLTANLKDKSSMGALRITPGLAYHFSSKNILDVYLGGYVPIGFDAEKEIWQTEGSGFDYAYNTKRTTFILGAGVFIGLQCFVADLPFAIGLESNLSILGRMGDKYKHTIYEDDKSQTFYTSDGEVDGMRFTKLNSSSMDCGADIRLTFTYFFNNKK